MSEQMTGNDKQTVHCSCAFIIAFLFLLVGLLSLHFYFLILVFNAFCYYNEILPSCSTEAFLFSNARR